jgi:hypothetical protein
MFYLPTPDPPRWGRDEFTYAVSDLSALWFSTKRDPADPDLFNWRFPAWMPDFQDNFLGIEALAPAPVAVFGVPDAANLTGSRAGVVYGRLLGVTFGLRGGRVTLSFSLTMTETRLIRS